MDRKTFFTYLSVLTVILLAITAIVHNKGEIGRFTDFSILCIASFYVFSILIFFMGLNAIKSRNKYSFNNLVILNMILKMVLIVLIILIYKQVKDFDSQGFIIPFLVIYLAYTIFETYFLMKLAKQSV